MSPFWISLELRMMDVVVTTGAIRCAKLQSNGNHRQTNTQLFTGRIPFLSPNKHWRDRNDNSSHSAPAACNVYRKTSDWSWVLCISHVSMVTDLQYWFESIGTCTPKRFHILHWRCPRYRPASVRLEQGIAASVAGKYCGNPRGKIWLS